MSPRARPSRSARSAPPVRIVIERLVLDGLAVTAAEAEVVAAAFGAELRGLVAATLAKQPGALDAVYVPAACGPAVAAPPGLPADALGGALGASVHAAVTGVAGVPGPGR